jgi:hypothetical protein
MPSATTDCSLQVTGIAVFRDSAGTVWMTQDFAN